MQLIHSLLARFPRFNMPTCRVDYADLNRSRFSEKAFAVMDRDGSGEVDFLEFVLAVWNYCSFNQASLVRFAFDLYDVDGSGEIERDEVGMCIREVWGSDWESNSAAQKIMIKLETIMESTVSGRLTVKLFQEFAVRHPMLLFPAFQLQTEIQNKVLGERFWAKAAKRRGSMKPEDLQWGNMQAMVKLAKKSSSQLLKAIEDDLGEQVGQNLRPKHAPTGGKKRGAASVGAIAEEHTTSKSRSSIPNSKGTASTPTSPAAGTTTRHKRRWSDQAGVSKAAIAGLIVENLDDSED